MSDLETCPRTEALSALTDDELRGAERSALEAHVAGCAICASALAELRGLRSRFAALPETAPEFDLAALVDRRIAVAAVPKRPTTRYPSSRPRWWQVAVLAPGGALAVAIGLWLGAMMPASLASRGAPSAQMAAFSALPPGALCPALDPCTRVLP